MIRLATKADLLQIAKVHSVCFPNSFSSQLSRLQTIAGGGNLLVQFYNEYLKDAPELFHVACDENGNIVGICMGYYMDNDGQMGRFIRKYRAKFIWKALLLLAGGNKVAWRKFTVGIFGKKKTSTWEIINQKYEHILNNKRGDLLSVCVLPQARGKGYAQQLMESFLASMKASGKEICLLSVDGDNVAARKYYERNGFEVYRTREDGGLTYIKPLNDVDNV